MCTEQMQRLSIVGVNSNDFGHDDNTINIVVVIVIINRLLLSCKLLRYISEVCSVSTQVLVVHSCLAS